jgi:hypothetical protein
MHILIGMSTRYGGKIVIFAILYTYLVYILGSNSNFWFAPPAFKLARAHCANRKRGVGFCGPLQPILRRSAAPVIPGHFEL